MEDGAKSGKTFAHGMIGFLKSQSERKKSMDKEEAIRILTESGNVEGCEVYKQAYWMAVEALRMQNEEKEATWMIEPNETGFYKCSACGFGTLVSFPHCPGCGRRMKKFWEE